MKELAEKCRKIIGSETARVSKPSGRMFLIIGKKINTLKDAGMITINGRRSDFDYVEEKVIASGNTEQELIDSVRQYKKLMNMSWEEFVESGMQI